MPHRISLRAYQLHHFLRCEKMITLVGPGYYVCIIFFITFAGRDYSTWEIILWEDIMTLMVDYHKSSDYYTCGCNKPVYYKSMRSVLFEYEALARNYVMVETGCCLSYQPYPMYCSNLTEREAGVSRFSGFIRIGDGICSLRSRVLSVAYIVQKIAKLTCLAKSESHVLCVGHIIVSI